MPSTLASVMVGLAMPLMAGVAPGSAASIATASDAAAARDPAPPFPGDYSWLNGNNYQPASLLITGPVTWSMMVDSYYGYAFNAPKDHTAFPTTTAPRHNEVNLNLATLGAEVTGVKGVIGKLVLQNGNYVDTITGTDPTAARGAYSGLSNMRHVQQAYLGYRLPILHGASLMTGIFPAYIGLESYWPQENWNYTHSLVSDFTPYYLTGAAVQLYPRQDLKTELWLVNGWQSLSKFGEAPGLGWSVNWRPSERLSLTHNFLGGWFEADRSRARLYADNTLQWQYARNPLPGIKSLAVAAVADVGYSTAGAQLPATVLGGGALLHRIEFNDQWALGVRGSFYSDPQKIVALALPAGAVPDGELVAAEATATLDYKPLPWLLYRLEYRHDWSSIPFIAGPGGMTPATPGDQAFRPDLRTSGGRVTLNATLRF